MESDAIIYNEREIVSIAKRENNNKRNYLVVNKLQGKYVPASPAKALELFSRLASTFENEYKDEKILYLGFAETATAVGSQVAIVMGGLYMQTTRENMPIECFSFSEEHSHAPKQLLVKDDIDKYTDEIDRIIFVEDEVTTGNTILNIVDILDEAYPNTFKYSVASILNGMAEERLDIFRRREIPLHYVLKINSEDYSEKANKCAEDGDYEDADFQKKSEIRLDCVGQYINPRRITSTKNYLAACQALWRNVSNMYSFERDKSYLIVGTEEMMYPALFVGREIEKLGCKVVSNSTTRGPVLTAKDDGYPLHSRHELRSLYDSERVTFLYEVDSYDQVIVITDANPELDALYTLYNALARKNDSISFIRWC